MYRLIPVILVLLLSFSLAFAAEMPSGSTAAPRYVPDVVVLVFSVGFQPDTVSFTYNKVGTTKQEAEQDVQALENLTQVKFNNIKVTSKTLPPSKEVLTSSEFQVNGFVDYKNGALIIEPFITALKRFKNIEVVYIINGKFPFRGLKDYDDKYVSVKMIKSYQYRIMVKDPGFTALNLPVIVQPQTTGGKAQTSKGGRSNLLAAMGIALVAGLAVYFGAKRFSKTPA